MPFPLRVAQWLSMTRVICARHSIDPTVMLAIIDRESGGGEYLTPKGPRGTGDFGKPGKPSFRDRAKGEFGHGRGLCQIDDRAHAAWCLRKDPKSGLFLWEIPEENIDKGASILAAALRTFKGDMRLALAAYNCGPTNVAESIASIAPGDAFYCAGDSRTHGGDYSADVLRRMAEFARASPLKKELPSV